MDKILLIDVFNFLHRAYHALPKTFTDSEGNPTNAIYGVSSMLITIFDTVSPTHVVAALESRGPTLREQDFSHYKAQRKPMDEMLEVQIPHVIDMIRAFGAETIFHEGYEADDVIGTIATKYRGSADFEVIIASNDRDLWQLADSNVVFVLPSTKDNGVEWLGYKEIEKRLGFSPKYLIDYKGLRGDPSDNIPGVAGIGDVTATKLITEFGTLEELYPRLSEVKPASVQKKLEDSRQSAFDSKQLATIVTDLDFDFDLNSCKYSTFNKGNVKAALEKYNFKSLIKKLGFEVSSSKNSSRNDFNSGQVSLF